MRPAEAPIQEFSTARMISFDYLNTQPDYDITVDGFHEFYANGICVKNCMGDFHPHGDSSIYGAMVTMVNQDNPPVFGSGSFGTQLDSASSMRYTEGSLSDYGKRNFFEYLPSIDYIPNYDGSKREPLILPSSLPNLLLNGNFGIAMGATSKIPAFKVAGVAKLAKQAMGGKPVTVKDCMKHLEPTTLEGGWAWLEDEENWSYTGELRRFYETGEGSIYWMPQYTLDKKARSLRITGFVPSGVIGLNASLNRVAAEADKHGIEVQTIDLTDIDPLTEKTKLMYEFVIGDSTPDDEVEAALLMVRSCFEGSVQLCMNVNERSINDDLEREVTFETMPMPDLFNRWAKWRIGIEKVQIQFEMDAEAVTLERNELLKLAVDNLDVIVKALKREDTEIFMQKQLKITAEQVTIILALTVGRLKKLEADKIVESIKKGKLRIKELKAELKSPLARIVAVIDDVAKLAK